MYGMKKEPLKAPRPLYEIANDIKIDWYPIYFEAKPYLDAMTAMQLPTEPYGLDPGYQIVSYFLANAQTWRGETARRIKQELKDALKYYDLPC
jgi:hypothetical protein